jgi:hypothetical protein
MKDVRDANVIQTKVFELTREIMSAQSRALGAQAAQAELIDEKRYQLKDFGGGTYAYELKPSEANGEPIHRVCPTCFESGKRHILQARGTDAFEREMFGCYECDQLFSFGPKQTNLNRTFDTSPLAPV